MKHNIKNPYQNKNKKIRRHNRLAVKFMVLDILFTEGKIRERRLQDENVLSEYKN